MASANNKALETQKLDYERVAEEKFNKILAAYRQVIDEISPEYFEEVDKIIEKETKKKFEVDKANSLLKERLFESIKKKFSKIWSELEMNQKLITLEYGKNNLTNEEKWRPTGLSVEDQCDPYAIKALLMQRSMWKQQIEFQNKQIAQIIPQIEDARNLIKSKIEKRNQISMQMKQDLEKIKEAENKIAITYSNP